MFVDKEYFLELIDKYNGQSLAELKAEIKCDEITLFGLKIVLETQFRR